MGSRVVSLAIPFYGVFVAVAALISAIFSVRIEVGAEHPPAAVLVGLLSAAGTVTFGLVAYRAVPVVRELADEVAPALLRGTGVGGLILISVLSGVGEEVLFRGALLPLLGLVVSSVLFGLLHIGPDRRYLLWTAWAMVVGLLFGLLYEWTGGLIAPVVAHATHNAVTLLLWRRRWMLATPAEQGGAA